MSNNIARLGVLLGLDSAEFTKGIDAANKKLYDFGSAVATHGKMALLAAGTAFAAATYKAMEFADGVSDVAKANDIAIDSVLKLSNALANNGGEADNAGKLLASFTSFVGSAAKGSFEAQKSFQQAGVSLKDLGKMSTEDLFAKAVQGIAAIEDPMTRNAKAMEVFGKAAKGVDFVGLAADISKASSTTTQQAQAVNDAAEAWDLLNQRTRDFNLTLVSEIGPSIKTSVQYFLALFDSVNNTGGLWKTTFNAIAYQTASLVHEVQDLVKVFGAWRDVLVAISDLKFSFDTSDVNQRPDYASVQKVIDARYADRKAEEAKLEKFRLALDLPLNRQGQGFADPRILGSTEDNSIKRKITPGIDTAAETARKKQLELVKKGLEVAAEQREEARKAIADMEDGYSKGRAAQMEKQRMQGQELERSQELFKLEQAGIDLRAEDLQLQKDLLEITNKHKDAIEAINSNKSLDIDARATALKNENNLMQKAIDLANERNQIVKNARLGSYEEGLAKSMAKYFDNMPTELERGKLAFESFAQNMESALDRFVDSGKLSFADLASSIIKDLIKIELKASAVNMLKSVGGEGGNILSTIFSFGKSLLGFADGGTPPVNQASMVGERGPELFIPKTAGTIIPNNALAGAMGGTTVNYNGPFIQSMSAIDTQSGIAFLAKNKQAVFASYQSANRSIPMSR